MSMVRCDKCESLIDSDDHPECFIEVPWLNMETRVWCQWCAEDEFEKHDREMSISEREPPDLSSTPNGEPT